MLVLMFAISSNLLALIGKGGVWLFINTSRNSNSFFVGESVDLIFNALLIVTRSLCKESGGSPDSHKTEMFGEDLNAPLQILSPRVCIGSRDLRAACVADP